jgi:hypothetical protein
MDISVSKQKGTLALAGLLALTFGAGAMQAANALKIQQTGVTITTVALACSTQTGTNVQTITVSAVTAPGVGHQYTVTVTTAPAHGIVVTAPSPAVITPTNLTLTYTVANAPGCVGNTSSGGTPYTLGFSSQLDAGAVTADASITVSDTITVGAASGLVASGVTINCVYTSGGGGTWTPGPAQTVYVSSTAGGGMPFTAVTSGLTAPAAWITLNPGTPAATAGSTAATFTVAATPTGGSSGCGGFTSGTHTTSLHLASNYAGAGAPSPDLVITITMLVVPPSPLTVTPVPAAPSISLSYVKGSAVAGAANVSVTSTPTALFFTVNTASFPAWLAVNRNSATTTAPLAFSTTSAADLLAPGAYSATIYLQVSGYGDYPVTITLELTNKAPTLSVNSPISISWGLGSPIPTATITATSSDTPIAYTITTGGTLQPQVGAPVCQGTICVGATGLAYSFGTNIPVTFNSSVFSSAQPGQILTGTVTFSWGTPVTTTVVAINVTVTSGAAVITGISPATLPTATSPTTFTMVLTGSGFVGGNNPTLSTKVGLAAGGPPATITPDSNFSMVVNDSTHITLTVTVPTIADPNLPFAPGGVGGVVGGTVNVGVCNGVCTTATGIATFTIGNAPIIQGVTSSSSFIEVAPGTLPTIAPYDMISIFGANFCSAGNTGYDITYNCGTNTVLGGTPSTTTLVYQPFVTNGEPAGATQRQVTVSFYLHGAESGAALATAPVLFATNSQINALVPSAVSGHTGAGAVDVVVNFGYGAYGSATLLSSNPFNVNIAATDPGVFTVGSDGQGTAAALNTAYNLIGSNSPAGARTGGHTVGDGDVVQLYVTGLGVPNSTFSNSSSGTGIFPTDCIAATGATSYSTALQALGYVPLTIDGAIIQSKLIDTGDLAPCFTTSPVVAIGGVPATVTYAGFVDDTVAGLYQINAVIPPSTSTFYPNWTPSANGTALGSMTQPVQLPVHVEFPSTVWSQNNVMLWVGPKLLMVKGAGVTTVTATSGSYAATVGTAVASLGATAFEGTGSYTYAISSGVLPSGLTLNTATGVISGTPNIGTGGTYAVTITATDQAAIPLTGSYSITITVNGALLVSGIGGSPFADSPYGTVAPTTITTLVASGGTVPYSYQITSSPVPAGMAVGAASGVVTTSDNTPAGQYTAIVVTATDSGSPALTGTATFEIDIPLALTTLISPTPQAHTDTTDALYQVTATGNTGTVVYTMTPISNTGSGGSLAINAATGAVTVGTATAGSYLFTVTATDSVTKAPGASGFGTATTITITVTVT